MKTAEALSQLAREIRNYQKRPFSNLTPAIRLVDDLGLDSMNLIQLSVMVYENFDVDLGRVANQKQKRFQTIAHILEELELSE
jgi:acyl carrier protein